MEKSWFRTNEDPVWKRENSVDPVFLILVLALLALGLVMLWSASSAQSRFDSNYTTSTRYLQKQAVCAILGLGCMAVFSRVQVDLWRRFAWHIYLIAIVLLLAVLAVGQSVNGAKRWVSIAGIQFQPSEIAKFAVILLLARLTRLFGTRAPPGMPPPPLSASGSGACAAPAQLPQENPPGYRSAHIKYRRFSWFDPLLFQLFL